jgi:hypothetical protein
MATKVDFDLKKSDLFPERFAPRAATARRGVAAETEEL